MKRETKLITIPRNKQNSGIKEWLDTVLSGAVKALRHNLKRKQSLSKRPEFNYIKRDPDFKNETHNP